MFINFATGVTVHSGFSSARFPLKQLCLTRVAPNSLGTNKPVALGFRIPLWLCVRLHDTSASHSGASSHRGRCTGSRFSLRGATVRSILVRSVGVENYENRDKSRTSTKLGREIL